jgi:hypothetical protein
MHLLAEQTGQLLANLDSSERPRHIQAKGANLASLQEGTVNPGASG